MTLPAPVHAGYDDGSQSHTQSKFEATGNGLWIVDPSDRGADVPRLGRSLFDHIFRTERGGRVVYDIPFPFSKLVDHIRSQLANPDSLKQVMIPEGRSLRRHAADPEYYRYPRFIVTADGEPLESPGHAGLLFKSRLFLGYQEKSSVLEVISYNPDAGRFEFQEVQDYGPGLRPRVTYANRAICLSCHQNAGPIFASEPWRETDANRRVSARLRAANPSLPAKSRYAPRFDDVWTIDYASDRATYFSSSQFIWRQGCDANDMISIGESIRCRAGMLSAVLQYRLAGGIEQQSRRYQEFLSVVTRNWRKRWPHGLYIATADIPDRDPFSKTVSTIQDPLTLRPPRAFWSTPRPRLLAGVVGQLADFLGAADVRRIDGYLYHQALERGVPRNDYTSSCRLRRNNSGAATPVRFFCKVPAGSTKPGFNASGLLHVAGDRVVNGRIDLRNFANVPGLWQLSLGEGEIEIHGGERVVRLRVKSNKTGLGIKADTSGLSARLRDGTLLERLRLSWLVDKEQNRNEFTAQGHLTTLHDFAPLDQAIESLAHMTISGKTDALSSKPFRRRSVLKALHKELGMKPLTWRQDEFRPAPVAIADAQTIQSAETGSFRSFYRYCATCHGQAGQFPPGFLHGDPDQVNRKFTECAQTILSRLSMWHLDPEQRAVSAMPPAHWLRGSGWAEAEWRQSEALAELQSAARRLLTNRGLTRDHTSSRLCLH